MNWLWARLKEPSTMNALGGAFTAAATATGSGAPLSAALAAFFMGFVMSEKGGK